VSRLLLDEKPLIILPSLAKTVGLNEAIILQQLHYWLQQSTNIRDGYKWVYNTYDDWKEQFPFWSKSTIRRTITKLENAGLIIVGKYNKLKIDNTKWYRINYEALEDMSRPSAQNEQTECSKWADGVLNLNTPLPETTTETTTEKVVVVDPIQFYQENFGVLNSFITEEIIHWINDMGSELVVEAMKRALKQQKKWNYAESILKNWANENVKTLQDVEALETEFRNRKKNNKKSIQEIDWDEL
jgi:DnaD/phage-associated family protein